MPLTKHRRYVIFHIRYNESGYETRQSYDQSTERAITYVRNKGIVILLKRLEESRVVLENMS